MTRVLIVEDSQAQAEVYRRWLAARSYDVLVAANGVDAIAQMQSDHTDLVLTDMQMPEMDGLELLDRLQFQYPEIPIILMTAHGSEDLAVQALQRGAAAYVPKSNIESTLLPTVEQVLELVRAERSYAGLLARLTKNTFTFRLTNDADLIGPLDDLLQQMMRAIQFGDPIQRVRVGMAVEHALLNAVYRGNLELDREQLAGVTGAADAEIVSERASQAPYCDRRISFDASITNNEARFVICDEGPGFDTSLRPAPGDPTVLETDGGRGLVLMTSFMDEVVFNSQGNEVTLTKRA